ncbi:MAG: hypothetical protein ABI432_01460 [Flavobacteriales bacterium]
MGPGALLRRIALFGLFVLAVLALFYWGGPHVSQVDFLGAARLKQERLRRLGSPKVVVIGGSNAAFGIDSEALERGLCRPVVNMGLHAALGFRYMTAEVVDQLGAGDVVVVALENSNFEKPDRMEDVLSITVDRYPPAIGFVPWEERAGLVFGLALWRMQATWNAWLHPEPRPDMGIYTEGSFNERGDMVAHLDMAIPLERKEETDEFDTLYVAERFWPIATGFNERAKAAGAKVLFSWPSVARSVYRPADSEAVKRAMEGHGLIVIGSPSDYVFPDSLFFDTWYHLHAVGRTQRTAMLLRDVCLAEAGICCAEKK